MRLLLKILVVVTWVMVGVFAAVKLRSAPQSAPELAVLGGWERSLPMLIRLGRERGLTVHALRAEDVGALMADSWPWMVSPLAYDLKLNLTAGAGFKRRS